MPPAEAHAILLGQRLSQRKPSRVVTRAFVLELEIGWKLSLRSLPKGADRGLGREHVLAADLVCVFVTDVPGIEIGQVARAIDVLVHFIGGRQIKRACLISATEAIQVSEGTVVTGWRQCAAARNVSAIAVRFGGGDDAAVVGAVLARRVHRLERDAAPAGGLVPNRMSRPQTEFDAVVASGIADHDPVIAKHPGERIQAIGRCLVGRLRLTDHRGAPIVAGEADKAVARKQSAVDSVAGVRGRVFGSGRCGNIDSRFQLPDEVEIVLQRMRAADAHVRQVGRDRRLPPHPPHRHAAHVAVIALEALRRIVERNVEVSVERHFAAARSKKRQSVARLALEERRIFRLLLLHLVLLCLLLFLHFRRYRIELSFQCVELLLQRVESGFEVTRFVGPSRSG